ncbi:low molecular weight protein-tyrosine-phosphatase [Aquimarina sp. 2201CG5-10]|uniref:low molecular weight protein-tyrosine-phosphatase n=1 Tax=Aquimarina callyspongiae TaxID=3098150 RepID=UPI002AB53B8E|nr:low molecular weight protein-tyrosine-phosphatase [Aquimarina sp. 2201CG5-10]MDY8138287.1 low molecular weight protein-tyrosine-phosphatase [Aquimarina sp. 2201CG5-10]
MKVKILMVCLGNICRSPLAEGILQSKLDSDHYQVDSCGTSSYHIGERPDSRSIQVAKKYDINISNQRAAQFKTSDFDTYDLIYAMDNSNYQNITKLARNPEDKKKVSLILDELYPKGSMDVPDPYYGGDQGFEDVFSMLDKASDKIAKKLKTN